MRLRVFGFALSSWAAAAFLSGCEGSQPQTVALGALPDARSTAAQRVSGSTYTVKPGLLFVAVTDPEYPYDDVQIYDVKEKNPKPLAIIRDGVSQPDDACIDGNKTLYVMNDAGSGWVSEYALGSTSPSKMITAGIDYPAFCAIDSRGDLWVTNVNAPDVTEYLPGGTAPQTVITDGITYPVGVAIDHAGNIYVANRYSQSETNVQVYRPGATSPSRTITDGVEWPVGIGVDAASVLYVTNLIPGNVREYRPGRNKPDKKITQGMNGPAAVTFAKNGWMYITNVGAQGGGSGSPNVVLEFPPGSQQPSKKMISKGLREPGGTAYYPTLLP
jgi:hypothetical protein